MSLQRSDWLMQMPSMQVSAAVGKCRKARTAVLGSVHMLDGDVHMLEPVQPHFRAMSNG